MYRTWRCMQYLEFEQGDMHYNYPSKKKRTLIKAA
jgi:hypothetical protein